MGFEVPENVIQLAFEDPSWNGLVVKMSIPTLDELRETAKLRTSQDPQAIEPVLEAFASHLHEWNLMRKGVPVPATRKGIGSLDGVFSLQLVGSWLGASGRLVEEVAEPIARELERTLPMQVVES
jgi:hypothetical protein